METTVTIKCIEDLAGPQVEPDQEANDLLKNGILIETSKGYVYTNILKTLGYYYCNFRLVCMSLNDALSSDLNLSVDDLRSVAAQLIIQQNIVSSKDKVAPNAGRVCDSDGGFSSECSDSTYTTSGSNTAYSTFTKFGDLSSEIQLTNITWPTGKSNRLF